MTIHVACNQPWLLSVQTDNPLVQANCRHVGSSGGMASAGHTFTVVLTCAAEAIGPQHATLATRLVSGPLVAGLPR